MKTQRDTKQRAAFMAAFEAHTDLLLSPKEILAHASREVPNLGIATVYRNIKAAVEDGRLRPVVIPGQADRYQLATRPVPTAIAILKDGTVSTDPAVYNALVNSRDVRIHRFAFEV